MRRRNNRIVQEQLRQIVGLGLCSNAPVEFGNGMIWINGRELPVTGHCGVVFVTLADYAVLKPGKGVSAKEILSLLNARRADFESWKWSLPASTTAINNAAFDLRTALTNAGLDPKIIETKSHRFYRLSVPSVNIIDLGDSPPTIVAN